MLHVHVMAVLSRRGVAPRVHGCHARWQEFGNGNGNGIIDTRVTRCVWRSMGWTRVVLALAALSQACAKLPYDPLTDRIQHGARVLRGRLARGLTSRAHALSRSPLVARL